jgi:hypothetical protein
MHKIFVGNATDSFRTNRSGTLHVEVSGVQFYTGSMPVLPWWIGKPVGDYEQLFLGASFGPATATEFVILAENVTDWVLNSHSCFASYDHGGGSAMLDICYWRSKW